MNATAIRGFIKSPFLGAQEPAAAEAWVIARRFMRSSASPSTSGRSSRRRLRERLEIAGGVVSDTCPLLPYTNIPSYSLSLMRRDDFERLYEEHAQPLFGFLAYRTGDRPWPRTSWPRPSSAPCGRGTASTGARPARRPGYTRSRSTACATAPAGASTEARALERMRPSRADAADELAAVEHATRSTGRSAAERRGARGDRPALRRRPDRARDREAAEAAASTDRGSRLPLAAQNAGRARLVRVRRLGPPRRCRKNSRGSSRLGPASASRISRCHSGSRSSNDSAAETAR